jgi:hypothetical protein
VKRNTTVARMTPTEAGVGRIRNLETKIALVPVNSPQHDALSTAIRIEANKYRKALDTEQATATHDATVQPTVGPGALKRTSASRKPIAVPRGRRRSGSRSDPRR